MPTTRPRVRRTSTRKPNEDSCGVLRLWLLRALVPLGAHRKFVQDLGMQNDALTKALGLPCWTDSGFDEWFNLVECSTLCEAEEEVHDVLKSGQREIAVRTELRRLHRTAERTICKYDLPKPLRVNLVRLAALVGLSEVDVQVIEFLVMLNSDCLLLEVVDWLGELSTVKLFHALAVMLALPEAAVSQALDGQGVLARSSLLVCKRNGADTIESKLLLLNESFADQIISAEMDPVDLLRDHVSLCPAPHLAERDYAHIDSTLGVLLPYLRQALVAKRKGVNVFIYGPPGTGKTQLARVLAANLACEVFEVASEDASGDAVMASQRLRAFRAAQCMLARRQVMIAFDEASDVFDDGDYLYGRKSTAQVNKAAMNRTLEENPVPALWLSNAINCLDPAFVRRFDMVIELPVPPRQQRQRILADVCGDMLDEIAVARIAESEELTPAIAARSVAVVRSIRSHLSAQAAGLAVERLIGNTLHAQGHAAILLNDPSRLPEAYSPDFLNADTDLTILGRGLTRQRQGRICLYGPSGTGKSAYGRWLARQLDVPLLVRRGSDLMSMWLGESEKNVALAFRQAERDKAVLLIDEVDGFLQDRRDAQRSWEVTLVNEMLTQIESFSGVFIATTNLMEGLEPAALRRFDLKVRFDYLKPEQAWELLVCQCKALGLATPHTSLRRRLHQIANLTPGDFAAVARQHRFRAVTSAGSLVAALAAESAVKAGNRTVMGFV